MSLLDFLDVSAHLSQVTLTPGSTARVQSASSTTHYAAHCQAVEVGLVSSEAGRKAQALFQSCQLLKKLLGTLGNAINWSCMHGLKGFSSHASFDASLHGCTNKHGNTNCGVVDDPDVNCAIEVCYL